MLSVFLLNFNLKINCFNNNINNEAKDFKKSNITQFNDLTRAKISAYIIAKFNSDCFYGQKDIIKHLLYDKSFNYIINEKSFINIINSKNLFFNDKIFIINNIFDRILQYSEKIALDFKKEVPNNNLIIVAINESLPEDFIINIINYLFCIENIIKSMKLNIHGKSITNFSIEIIIKSAFNIFDYVLFKNYLKLFNLLLSNSLFDDHFLDFYYKMRISLNSENLDISKNNLRNSYYNVLLNNEYLLSSLKEKYILLSNNYKLIRLSNDSNLFLNKENKKQ